MSVIEKNYDVVVEGLLESAPHWPVPEGEQLQP